MLAGKNTLEEWFRSECFGKSELSEDELAVVEYFMEELADSPEDLLFLEKDEIEEAMKHLKMKPKQKGKVRRAIEDLKKQDEELKKQDEEKMAEASDPEKPSQTAGDQMQKPSESLSESKETHKVFSSGPMLVDEDQPEAKFAQDTKTQALPTGTRTPPQQTRYSRAPASPGMGSEHKKNGHKVFTPGPMLIEEDEPEIIFAQDVKTQALPRATRTSPQAKYSGAYASPGAGWTYPRGCRDPNCYDPRHLRCNQNNVPMVSPDRQTFQQQQQQRTNRADIPRQMGTYIVSTVPKSQVTGPWKTIMVVGETGCGKTTTLNSIVNYLWGVELTDHFRYVLVPPPSSLAAQAHSVTSDVTAYHLRPPKLMYGLTIIDTPGFGDTKGLAADQLIVDKIEHAFKNEIDTLDGIFFIMRSSGRFDAQMKYVFNSVLKLFGNDLVRNLFTLITFADGATPPVLASIKEANIPAQENFELNNSAFFNGFDTDRAVPLTPYHCFQPGEQIPPFPIPQGIRERPHTEMFWQLGTTAMDKLFSALEKTQAISLKLSVDNLNVRKKLQLKIIHLQQQVSNGLDKIANLRQVIDTIMRNAREIESSRDFTIEGQKNELYEEHTGDNNTTCTNCKQTCHESCAFENNQDKVKCIAMDNEYCTICKDKCHWSAHVNDKFVLKTRTVKTSVVRDEIKKKFDKSTEDLTFSERAVIAYSNEIIDEQNNVKISITELREAIAELGRIAMRPCIMEEAEYYQKLIETEEAQKTPGWKARVKALKELKLQAQTVEQVMNNEHAEAVIFQSAMTQLQKDLSEIQTIMGKGKDENARKSLQNVERHMTKLRVGPMDLYSQSNQRPSPPAAAAKTTTTAQSGRFVAKSLAPMSGIRSWLGTGGSN